MPFTSTPDVPTAAITDIGRMNLARVALGNYSFEITSFAVGNSGYQDANPVKIEPIDPSQSMLMNQVYPVSPALQPVEKLEFPTNQTVVVYCRLDQNSAISALGEVGIWATVIDSPNHAEIGTTFMFAVAHTPIITKTFNQVTLYRFVIQF